MRGKWWAPAGFAAAALVLAACGTSSSSTSASSGSASSSTPSAASSAASGTTIKMTKINGKKVLTNAQGMVLYWFAPDTATKSSCNSQCLKYWPLVQGPATAGAGVTGTLSVITTNGVKQVVYDSHPLYTYVGDTGPGMDKGNGLNASGGLWWAVTPAGGKLKAATTGTSSGSSSGGSSSTGSGGGGYGY
jgi:predicted lipoprotein with Yx(FWY)xxD motif